MTETLILCTTGENPPTKSIQYNVKEIKKREIGSCRIDSERKTRKKYRKFHYRTRRVQVLRQGNAEALALSFSGHACSRPLP